MTTRTSRLALPQVTLVGVDLFNPLSTFRAMIFCMRQVTFAEAVIVSGAPFHLQGGLRGARNLVLGRGARPEERTVRERFMTTQLHEAFNTTHVLHIEGDGFVANPSAWEDSFLDWDFIGAPWPWPYTEAGYVPCTPNNCVGNTGFALMSRKFCVEAAKLPAPTEAHLSRASDAWLCRDSRPALEAVGIRFAPEAVAERFSCENRIYAGQFGLHGKFTIELNGIKPGVCM